MRLPYCKQCDEGEPTYEPYRPDKKWWDEDDHEAASNAYLGFMKAYVAYHTHSCPEKDVLESFNNALKQTYAPLKKMVYATTPFLKIVRKTKP